jgi:hypothetical protein
MLNFKEYKEELLLESIINEGYLYLSPRFRNMLKMINSDISSDILDKENNDIDADLTFIDITDKPGYISFITNSNSVKVLKDISNSDNNDHIVYFNYLKNNANIDRFPDLGLLSMGVAPALFDYDPKTSDGDTIYSIKSRNVTKIGKFVNKLLKGKYSDSEIEKFVNEFKALTDDVEIDLVKGSDIHKCYNIDNYYSKENTLGASCMNNKPSSFFEIYEDNEDVCQMMVLKKDDKILARALVWKLDLVNNKKVDNYYLDRQYAVNDYYVNVMINYAKEKGWYIRNSNNAVDIDIKSPDGKVGKYDMVVKINKSKYEYYPFMDTFIYLYTSNNTLGNKEDDDYDFLILDSTNGGSSERGVWSDYHNEYIDSEASIWSDYHDSYIKRAGSVWMDSTHSYVDINSDEIVYDQFIYEYYLKDECKYSHYYDMYIYEGCVVKGICKIGNNYKECILSEYDNYIIPLPNTELINKLDIYGKYTTRDLLKTSNDIPVFLLVKTFETISYNIKNLTKIDAYLLDVEINEDKFNYFDIETYLNSLGDVNKEITKLAEEHNSHPNNEKLSDSLKIRSNLKTLKDYKFGYDFGLNLL